MNAPRRIAALLGLPLLLAGCATADRSAESDRPAYRYVMETGSNIPRKVPVDRASDGGQNIEKVDGAAFHRLQQDQTMRRMIRPGG